MKKYSVTLALILLANLVQAGVDSVQLDSVALDANVECNRILFQSSQHLKNTLFAMPRVVPGNGIQAARLYTIRPSDKNGIYDLTVDLYFPSNDEVLKTSAASTTKKDLFACNWDKVKNSLNKNIRDPLLQIKTISRIPVTALEVKIQGIKNIGHTVSTVQDSDILDYYGKSLTVYFKVTELEKNDFQAQIVTAEGLTASIKFLFQARSRSGSVHAKIDLQNLSQNFSVAASAKGLKYLGSADLSATLKSSVTENSVQITSEAGSGEDVSKITSMLVDKILKEVDFSKNNIQLTDADKAKAGTGQISVAAVVEILKTKMTSEISFNLVSAPEKATAQTEVKIRTERLNDPHIIEVTVSAGYSDPTLGLSLNAGQSLTLTPAYWYLDKITYDENRSYLTTGEIQTLNLASSFEDLVNQNMSIKDIEINGTLLAEGRWAAIAGSSLTSWNRYRWARVQKTANRLRESSNIIPTNLSTLNELPIYLTFSELGDRRFVKLSELTQDNPFWKAVYDELTGRLIITAKQNLGTIRVRERLRGDENIKYAAQPAVLDQIFQQKTNMFGNSEYTANHIIKQDSRPIILQKSIVLYITRPRIMTAAELKHIKNTAVLMEIKP